MRLPGLRRQRELRCWTVTDLARTTGLSWTTADLADRGEEVSLQTARKILAALEAAPPSPVALELVEVERHLGPIERRSA